MSDPRYDALISHAESLGLTVVERSLPRRHRGRYYLRSNLIVLASGMTMRYRVATLAHELIHAELGHNGHQPQAIEDRVDERAAMMLINTQTYALAERMYGGHPGAIAKELDLPIWVIEAWQRSLARTGQAWPRAI